MSNHTLSGSEYENLIEVLQIRFAQNMSRHPGLEWTKVQAKIDASKQKQYSLYQMELTGGEPDVIDFDTNTGEYIFCDCSAESPIGRRSFCYDQEALDARREHKPKNSAQQMADEIGIKILTEDQYFELKKLGNFDAKTSSWLQAPSDIRKLGGALFGDRRFNKVFVYHNGAESYYSGRGFRGLIRV